MSATPAKTAERATLPASPRTPEGSRIARRLRRDGKVPGVLYGAGKPVLHVSLERKDLEKVLREHRRVVSLEVAGTAENALLQDVVFDAIDDDPMHVDLLRISEKTVVRLKVPLEFLGHPKGVTAGGEFVHTLAELEVECLPSDIPRSIPVKVAHLEIGQSIAVKDLEIPAGVKALHDPATTVCIVRVHHELAETPAPGAAETTAAEPERIGRKPSDEEGEDAAKEAAKPEAPKGKKE